MASKTSVTVSTQAGWRTYDLWSFTQTEINNWNSSATSIATLQSQINSLNNSYTTLNGTVSGLYNPSSDIQSLQAQIDDLTNQIANLPTSTGSPTTATVSDLVAPLTQEDTIAAAWMVVALFAVAWSFKAIGKTL